MKIFPIAEMINSSCAEVFGYPIYGGECPKPVKWLHRRLQAADRVRWWFLYRLHPKHQYHIVRTGLEPAFYCEDTLILHSCMAMLCRYVEWHGVETLEEHNKELREEGDPNAPEGLCESQADSQEKALKIYHWWKSEKPRDKAKEREMILALYGKECAVPEEERKQYREDLWALQEKIRTDEQTMLHRLVDIRESLWT